MNCMRRFRLESMGPRAIKRQRFSASGSGQGDVGNAYVENDDDYDENSHSKNDYVENGDAYDENGNASHVYAMDKQTAACVEYTVATCVGVGLVMFGIGCLLGYFYLPKSTHGIISRIAFMVVFVKFLLANKLGKMEAAVSAHAANSKWLGLGRRRFFFEKQSLFSINGMMSNSMNCMRRLRLESSWMGMGPRAIERQRFSASGSGQGDVENGDAYIENDDGYDENGDDYDENSDSDDEYVENSDDYDVNGDASPVYSMDEQTSACIEYAVATCIGIGLVMFGIGCLLGYFYLPKTHGIISPIAFMAIVLFHVQYLIRVFVKSLLVNKLARVLSASSCDESFYI
ncbi:hypothetical protein OROMI_020598 [Orobanche minor]